MAVALFLIVAVVLFSAGVFVTWQARRRHLHYWLSSHLRQGLRSRARPTRRQGGDVHALLCIADHFEPMWGGASPNRAAERVERWVQHYPKLFAHFRDSDGRAPRHTFFFPIDQYDPGHLDALGGLCRQGFGEVEIHLHHDNDTPENLRRTLDYYASLFAERHRLLARRRGEGRIAYGFIHGNWALDNSRPDGCWCGVNNELDVLRATGCYADFTLPSAPSPTQTRKINSIYYAADDPRRPKSHDRGVDVGMGTPPSNALMLIQGPLLLYRPAGRLVPKIENGCIQGNQPPSMARLEQWLRACVHVKGRPDWLFVKLHTHGAPEDNQQVLLGEPMVDFHRALARRAAADPHFHYHYLTAREMYNLVKAAESGWSGGVAEALDFELVCEPDYGTASPPEPHERKSADISMFRR